jgi:hypothetical protein
MNFLGISPVRHLSIMRHWYTVTLNGRGDLAVTNYQLIREAIQNRRCLDATYENYLRYFCPHRLGKDRTGKEIVEVFQYGGGCPGGLPYDGKWCSFEVSALHAVRSNADHWRIGVADRMRTDRVLDVDVSS